ncbi:MAG: ferrous iron transport protein A [Pirellulales bacterium]
MIKLTTPPRAMNTLSAARPGLVTCVRIDAQGDDAVRLKRMGICEGRELKILMVGDPMILLSSGARIGLSKALSDRVIVAGTDEPAAESAKSTEPFMMCVGQAGMLNRE